LDQNWALESAQSHRTGIARQFFEANLGDAPALTWVSAPVLDLHPDRCRCGDLNFGSRRQEAPGQSFSREVKGIMPVLHASRTFHAIKRDETRSADREPAGALEPHH
jgi:hypothetical protein